MKYLLINIFTIACLFSTFTDIREDLILSLDPDLTEEHIEELLAELEYYYLKPLDPNTASHSELIRLPFIDADLAAGIISNRKQNSYSTTRELTNVLSADEFHLLRHFLKTGNNYTSSTEGITVYLISSSKVSADLVRGPDPYKPLAWKGRIMANLGPWLSISLSGEHDAYEINNLDLKKSSISLIPPVPGLRMILGASRLQPSQGLLFTTRHSAFLSADSVHSLRRRESVIRQDIGFSEDYLSGAGLTAKIREINLILFLGRTRYDAVVQAPMWFSSGNWVTGIPAAPSPHTDRESLEKQNSLQENLFLSMIEFNLRSGNRLALNALYSSLDMPLLPDKAFSDSGFFMGRSYGGFSISWDIDILGTIIYGETSLQFFERPDTAWDYSITEKHLPCYAPSVVMGLERKHRLFKGSLFFRRYSHSHISRHTGTYSGFADPAGETGMLAGISINNLKRQRYDLSADIFHRDNSWRQKLILKHRLSSFGPLWLENRFRLKEGDETTAPGSGIPYDYRVRLSAGRKVFNFRTGLSLYSEAGGASAPPLGTMLSTEFRLEPLSIWSIVLKAGIYDCRDGQALQYMEYLGPGNYMYRYLENKGLILTLRSRIKTGKALGLHLGGAIDLNSLTEESYYSLSAVLETGF